MTLLYLGLTAVLNTLYNIRSHIQGPGNEHSQKLADHVDEGSLIKTAVIPPFQVFPRKEKPSTRKAWICRQSGLKGMHLNFCGGDLQTQGWTFSCTMSCGTNF